MIGLEYKRDANSPFGAYVSIDSRGTEHASGAENLLSSLHNGPLLCSPALAIPFTLRHLVPISAFIPSTHLNSSKVGKCFQTNKKLYIYISIY